MSSHTNEVFEIPGILENIFWKLDLKTLINCRLLSKKWNVEAEHVLQKRPGPDPNTPGTLDSDSEWVEFDEISTWLTTHVETATWFKTTEQMETFLKDMAACTGNPFPSRTVVLYFPDTNIGTRLWAQVTFVRALTELFSKFGEHIRFLYLALDETTEGNKDYRAHIWQTILKLSNLTFLNAYHADEGLDFLEITKLARQNPGTMKKLRTLQLYGADTMRIFREIFQSTGNASFIETLHLGSELGYSLVSAQKLENLRNLSFYDFSSEYWDPLPGQPYEGCLSNNLQELHIRLYCGASMFLRKIENAIQLADFTSSTKLRKLSIHVNPQMRLQYLVVDNDRRCSLMSSFRSRVWTNPDDFTRLSQVKYPELKVLCISYALIEAWPKLLALFCSKCSNWEELELENLSLSCAWRVKKHNEQTVSQEVFFQKLCGSLWDQLPESVTRITCMGSSVKATRP